MGGGVGYMANARQRALGNLYDLYSARSVGAGKSPGTFLSYLNNQAIPEPATFGPPSSVGEGGY